MPISKQYCARSVCCELFLRLINRLLKAKGRQDFVPTIFPEQIITYVRNDETKRYRHRHTNQLRYITPGQNDTKYDNETSGEVPAGEEHCLDERREKDGHQPVFLIVSTRYRNHLFLRREIKKTPRTVEESEYRER